MAVETAMSTSAPVAVFRCDASPTIGAGHVGRCLAFAEALSDAGWRVAFAVGPDTITTMPVIASGVFSVLELGGEKAAEPPALRQSYPGGVDLLVVDHYDRDIHFEKPCRSWARRILVMEDGTDRQHDCDVLVDAAACNQATYAGRVPTRACLLLGPAYALIRRSFLNRRPTALLRRDGRPVKRILLSFGATDPSNTTSAVLDALDFFVDNFAITVGMSSRAPHIDGVRRRMQGRCHLALDADMAELIAESDLAVGAAGASAFERAVLGLPSILLTLADNQLGISRILTQFGAAIDCQQIGSDFSTRLGDSVASLVADGRKRMEIAERASRLVDGRGASRIVEALSG
jgi:UDP-2,4-diacetamido-2,4,6-trideoxy-beta-L-altropyranose hydrolase